MATKVDGLRSINDAARGIDRAVTDQPKERILFQQKPVSAYAMFRLQWATNDIIAAALIADCTAAGETLHPRPDQHIAALAEHLTFSEQIEVFACARKRLIFATPG